MLTKSIQPLPVVNWVENYGVWEHLLIINPSRDVAEKVSKRRKRLQAHTKTRLQ
jgi:hypothetical protein